LKLSSYPLLSRRHFLQLAGIALAAPLVHAAPIAPAASRLPALRTTYGRALGSIPVYAAPSLDALLLQRLWSDTVMPIHEADGGWYRLQTGYTPREGVQPMTDAAHTGETAAPPFWGTVGGAVAVVREYCAVNAPVVARIGHGGVLRIVALLPGDGVDWYGVADDENSPLLGWTAAAVISPITLDAAAPTLTLAIDSAAFRLDVYENDQHLLAAPVSTGQDLVRGTYPITLRNMTAAPQDTFHGVPYVLTFGNQQLSGAYWHNRFGAPSPGAADPGTVVQVTPPLAGWLLPRAAEIIIS
jgi:hypothetical protein